MYEVDPPRDATVIEPALRVRIDHLKFGAERSQIRTVEANTTWWAGEFGFVRGYDLDRAAERTYRTDRIEGWLIADAPTWLAPTKTLFTDLRQVCELDRARAVRTRGGRFALRPSSYEAAIDYSASTIDELAAMTLVAAYVGGVDGRVSKLEQKALEVALGVWSRGLGIEPERLVGEHVDAAAFDEAVTALRSAPVTARRATLAAAHAISMATSGLKPEELRALIEVESAFALAPC